MRAPAWAEDSRVNMAQYSPAQPAGGHPHTHTACPAPFRTPPAAAPHLRPRGAPRHHTPLECPSHVARCVALPPHHGVLGVAPAAARVHESHDDGVAAREQHAHHRLHRDGLGHVTPARGGSATSWVECGDACACRCFPNVATKRSITTQRGLLAWPRAPRWRRRCCTCRGPGEPPRRPGPGAAARSQCP